MADNERRRSSSGPGLQLKPSEAEITLLLQDTAHEYEQYLELADLSIYASISEAELPRYSWNNPIGLVVTEGPNADMV